MRTLAVILALAPFAANAQQQQDQQQAGLTPPGSGAPVYDIVAADRETAWRIHRVTGEVTICRVDTTGGLDAVGARCTIATMRGAAAGSPEQSMNPPGGAPR